MSVTDPKDLPTTFEDVFDGIAFEGLQILYDRQRKYGPKNIQQQGLWGVFTRIKDDKISRIERVFNGIIRKGKIILDVILEPSEDELFEDALFDISNYALIMIALKRGQWGKPMREETDEVATLAAAHPDGIPQIEMTPEEEEAEMARQFLAGTPDEQTLEGSLAGPLFFLRSIGLGDEGAPADDEDQDVIRRQQAAARLEADRQARNLGGKDD